MRESRLPRIPGPYRLLLVLAAGAVCIFLGMWLAWSLSGNVASEMTKAILQPPPKVKMTAQLLRSEDLMFMVTNRVVTQIMVEQKQDSVWAGTREGILVATTRMYYGVDMGKVTDQDIHDMGDRVVIVLPSPGVLDFAIDPNFKIITKRSGVNVVLDWVYGNDIEAEMRSQIQSAAMKFAHVNDLLPMPRTVLARLNRTATVFTSKVGKPVIFAFEPPAATTQADEPPAASAAISPASQTAPSTAGSSQSQPGQPVSP